MGAGKKSNYLEAAGRIQYYILPLFDLLLPRPIIIIDTVSNTIYTYCINIKLIKFSPASKTPVYRGTFSTSGSEDPLT